MPRFTIAHVAALLLSASFVVGTAQAQLQRPLPQGPPTQETPTLETPTLEAQPSLGATESTDSPATQFPVRLVRRAEQADRSAVGSRYGEPVKLPAPKDSQSVGNRDAEDGRKRSSGSVTSVVFSSLAIVLGVFFLVVWLARRALPKSATGLPADVLEVLGRSPLASRHNLQLIRFGRRLLLVSVTPDNAETLAEITDPDEVNHLAGLCRQEQPNSITGSFRQVLQQLGSQQSSRSRRSRRAANPLDVDANASADRQTSLRHARELS